MQHIIGITGYAQHGKDTAGQRLVERWGYRRYGFADQLREMALRADPYVAVPVASSHQQDAENVTFRRLAAVIATAGWEMAKTCPDVRRFLQVLGTDCVRDLLGEGAWVDALRLRIARDGWSGPIVVTDVRFPNEADWIEDVGGLIVRVIRPNFDSGVLSTHASEKSIGMIPVYAVLVNDGTIPDLWGQVDQLVEENWP